MSNHEKNPCFDCPYMTENGRSDRNKFPHNQFFVGEIENGYRYPFGTYTKQETDKKFAVKETETRVDNLENVTSELEENKADKTEVTVIANEVKKKADKDKTSADINEIKARLDDLEYKSITINSFTASPSVAERGSTATINLAWTLNKSAVSQEINGASVTGNTKQYDNVTNNVTYTLSVSDGKNTANKSASVSFVNRIYYGSAADLSTVVNLESVLSDNKSRTITVNAEGGEYIIYAIPQRLGNVQFYVSGFEGGFDEPVVQQIRNANGYTEAYNVYKSTRPSLGETTIEIKGA